MEFLAYQGTGMSGVRGKRKLSKKVAPPWQGEKEGPPGQLGPGNYEKGISP